MAANVPIRLVRKDGTLIPLNATILTMDVDRGVNAHSLPFMGGERFGLDFNMAKSTIMMDGLIIDDDLSVSSGIGAKAFCFIDFSKNANDNNKNNLIHKWGLISGLQQNNSRGSNSVVPYVIITSESGDNYKIYFAKSSTTDFGYGVISSNTYHVTIHDDTNPLTALEIRNNMLNLINSSTVNSGVLKTKFLAFGGSTDSIIEIDQTVAGTNSNETTPLWNSICDAPHTTEFLGGESTNAAFTSMSAGDKVQMLYGTLNNSNDGGFTAISDGNIGAGLNPGPGKGARATKYGDYIIGIQIPFNSTRVSEEDATGEKYITKNFFMPTGPMHNTSTKDVTEAKIASSSIDDTNDEDDFSFIKGSVTKATFTKMAGEPIYEFKIIFIPIDYII